MPFSALIDAFAEQANIANLALLVALVAALWENRLLHRQVARLGDQVAEANRRFDGFVTQLSLFNARMNAASAAAAQEDEDG